MNFNVNDILKFNVLVEDDDKSRPLEFVCIVTSIEPDYFPRGNLYIGKVNLKILNCKGIRGYFQQCCLLKCLDGKIEFSCSSIYTLKLISDIEKLDTIELAL